MYIADLHIHSSYSRATAKNVTPEVLELWGRKKGIDVIGTGDFTHPQWRRELSERLEPLGDGLYRLKEEYILEKGKYKKAAAGSGDLREEKNGTEEGKRFVITGEISSIYKQDGSVRKVHSLIILPSFEDAERLSAKLETIGNIHSDGRPILGLSCHDLLEICLELCPRAIYVPAHIWTPHFSLFGAFSGFDSVEECFGDLAGEIHAVETGLSSDPLMNRRVSMLDKYQLISNSDAHSPAKLGREATIFSGDLSYDGLYEGIQKGKGLFGTIEFYPEEGKYHLDGHRKCHLSLTPSETESYKGICPVCGKKITVGVLHRVEELADRGEDYRHPDAKPFECLMPLNEVIGASWGKSPESAKVWECCEEMLSSLGPEFFILREASIADIKRAAGSSVAEGVKRLREGRVILKAGFDGEYGKVSLFTDDELKNSEGQLSFFEITQRKAEKSGKKSEKDMKSSEENTEDAGKSERIERNEEGASVLNDRQLLAVKSRSRVTAVSAGPGTGKTKTLIEAIIERVEERGVKPSEITAFTFTKKAAGELRERLNLRLGSKSRYIKTGTVHSICLELLKKAGEDRKTADEFVLKGYAGEAIEAFGLSLSVRDFLREVSLIKNRGEEYWETADRGNIRDAYLYYDRRLKEEGLMDFDDILINCIGLLHTKEGRKLKGKTFSYIFTDELQDLGMLEYEAVKTLFEGEKELFVIGDRDQSIYGFRGVSGDCFLRLKEDFPDLNMIRLNINYRSEPDIVEASRALISANPGVERELLSGKAGAESVTEGAESAKEQNYKARNSEEPNSKECNSKEHNSIEIARAESGLSEAIFIARKINELVGGIDMLDRDLRGDSPENTRGFSDIAVLYRSNYQAGLMERALRKEGIPYIVSGREEFLLEDSVRACVEFFKYVFLGDEAAGELYLNIMSGFKRNGLSAAILESERDKYIESAKAHNKVTPCDMISAWAKGAGLLKDDGIEKLMNCAIFYSDMEEFLNDLSMGEESDVSRAGSKSYSADAVRLSTVHGAKGLEFPVVFIFGADERKLPEEEAELFEERRIFFVAMTRAKEKLYICTAEHEPGFITDLPGELFKETEVKAYTKSDREKKSSGKQGVQLSIFDFI